MVSDTLRSTYTCNITCTLYIIIRTSTVHSISKNLINYIALCNNNNNIVEAKERKRKRKREREKGGGRKTETERDRETERERETSSLIIYVSPKGQTS